MSSYGRITARSLETFEPAQARREKEKIETFDVIAESDCEGACAPSRTSVSQPRGQHAHGSESVEEEIRQEASGKKDCDQENVEEVFPENCA
ncbi:hypothetical protein [Bradyrhizobium jicamae]|uniref:hypothetical protein n=1 Tax=Bradyrhizobium jicamae TaxID=280332 RepID=UPI000AF2A9F9|nr:hypothetical protein [Bradyrhizobium jicamae]